MAKVAVKKTKTTKKKKSVKRKKAVRKEPEAISSEEKVEASDGAADAPQVNHRNQNHFALHRPMVHHWIPPIPASSHLLFNFYLNLHN